MNLVIHDFEPGWDTYIEKPGYLVESDITFSEVDTQDYLAVLLLGAGHPSFCATMPRYLTLCGNSTAMTSTFSPFVTASRF